MFYVKFFAPVTQQSVVALMHAVGAKLREGHTEMGLLISTPGGDVTSGLTAYNYLRGIPLKVTTHNFGSADSIGAVIFCAGSRRFSVPHARFLIHGVAMSFNQSVVLEEQQLEERLKSLRIDMGNVAQVIADTVGKTRDQVMADMLARNTLYPDQAIEYGLIHEIRSELFPPGSDVSSVEMS